MTQLVQGVRYSFRMLMKRPLITLIAVLTLGLGIGANTAIFSVMNAALFRRLPLPNEQQLVVLREKKAGEEERLGNAASYLNFQDWQAQSQSFHSMAIVQADEATLTGEGEPARVNVAIASADIFKVLGTNLRMGRGFKPEEDLPGAAEGLNPVILSYDCWQRRFESDRKILGRMVTLDNQAFSVVGVMSAGIFPLQKEPVDFWMTVAYGGDAKKPGTMNGSRGYRAYIAAIGRLKENVSVQQAQAEMTSISRGLAEKYPASNKQYQTTVIQVRELLVGKARPLLFLLLGIVGSVLLIACANVASLLLARATVRQREMAIRSVLGASRWQIMQQLLLESVLLGLCGGVLGLLMSLWGVDWLIAAMPAEIPRITGLSPDWRVLLFTLGAAMLTGILCGLFPAIGAARNDLSLAMKEGGRSTTVARGGLRQALVVGEIAITLVLLIGAGLLLKSFWLLQRVDPGFDYRNVLTAKVVLAPERYKEPAQSKAFYDALLTNVKRLPGVTQASIAQSIPLTSNDNGTNFNIVGRPFPKGEEHEARLRFIGLNYFQTINLPTLNGRDFTDRDDEKAPPMVMINEAFARQYFRGENPLGKKLLLGWGGDEEKEIVGVVGNLRHRGLDDQARPEMYVPQAQFSTMDMTLLVKTNVNAESLSQAMTAEVRKLDPQLPVTKINTLEQYRSATVAFPRFNLLILSLFAGLALALTIIGLYGVISYAVTQRTNEIGVRMALGAQAFDILRMILNQGLRLVLIGLVLGLAGALALTRMMQSLLFEVSASDPLTYFLVAILLTLITLMASFIPAYRATKVDPVIALRYE
ncbi:MAG: ABC transporter permease [Acidobacteria bacterium]|nr:ABC transporter permease [Acidobacteriota bacterium]